MSDSRSLEIRTLARANTSLKPDKNLINPKFEQYKYTSGKEHDIRYAPLAHPPHRVHTTDTEYSYQMTRASCLFNHLITLDSRRFLVFTSPSPNTYQLCDVTHDDKSRVVHEFANTESLVFNISAKWSPSDRRLFVCLGSDLHVLAIGNEGDVVSRRPQQLEAQSLLLECFQRNGAVHLVTCHKCNDVFVHHIMKEQQDGQFGVVGVIKLSGIARFVSVVGDLLTVISEGKVQMVEVDPAVEGVTAVVASEPEPQPAAAKNFTWTQTMEEVEVVVDLPNGIVKSDLMVEITHDHLEVRTKGGQELFNSKLFSRVEPDDSSWQMSSDKKCVEVSMTKYQSAHSWAHLLHSPGYDPAGNLLGEISDLNEDELREMMGRMRSLDQYTSDKLDNSPLYTPNKELEECDELDGQQVLVAGFEMHRDVTADRDYDVITQRYLVELSPGSVLFCRDNHGFGVSHSVDACFYTPHTLDEPWQHSGTFHAFNMVQATKTQKKFMVTDERLGYVAIVDTSRHVYIYCAAARESCTGKLLVMTLDSDDSEVLGVFQKSDKIVLLTERNLITIQFSL